MSAIIKVFKDYMRAAYKLRPRIKDSNFKCAVNQLMVMCEALLAKCDPTFEDVNVFIQNSHIIVLDTLNSCKNVIKIDFRHSTNGDTGDRDPFDDTDPSDGAGLLALGGFRRL